MKISVIVCTHNRVHYLERAIGSLCAQTLPREHFEILLVDNASTDGTAAWAEKRCLDTPNLVYLHEPALGLSNARNVGWRAAKAELAAFFDDDAVANKTWLETIVRRFQEHDERLAVVAGHVYPLWEAPPPDWLVPGLWAPLALLDLGTNDLVMDPDHYFVGANMTIRKSALARVGGFSSALGRKGDRLLSNEEVHLKWLLERAGYYALYAPDVVVGHTVPAERMSKHWFRTRYWWQGVSDSVMQQVMHDPASTGDNTMGRNVKSSARFVRQWIGRRMRKPGRQPMRTRCVEYRTLGALFEDWRRYWQGARLPPDAS